MRTDAGSVSMASPRRAPPGPAADPRPGTPGDPHPMAPDEVDFDRGPAPAVQVRQAHGMEAHWRRRAAVNSPRPPGDPLGSHPVAPREPGQRFATGPPGLDHHPLLGLAPIPSAHHRRDVRLPRHPRLLSRPSSGRESIAQGGASRKHGKDGRLLTRRVCWRICRWQSSVRSLTSWAASKLGSKGRRRG